jgi:hypothetical protein
MSEEKTQEIERLSTFRLAFGITYWMGVQGCVAFSALRDFTEHKTGWMWLSIFLLFWASLMLWHKVDKWRAP